MGSRESHIRADIETGMLVRSKAGHDRKRLYLVVHKEDKWVWLTDGRCHLLDKPKKKNVLHVAAVSPVRHLDFIRTLSGLNETGQRNAAVRSLLEASTSPD